jgi:hypothetical protein
MLALRNSEWLALARVRVTVASFFVFLLRDSFDQGLDAEYFIAPPYSATLGSCASFSFTLSSS